MNNPIDQYIKAFSNEQDPLLRELERETYLRVKNPQMVSGHIQGLVLRALTQMIRPRNVLEIGTFTGYSALSIASALSEGAMLDTIEADDELESLARSFFERSPYGDKITQWIGSALEVMPRLAKQYDLVFIDGGKKEYPAYYEALWRYNLIKSGSWILADNVLWYGKVAEQGLNINDSDIEPNTDPQTATLIAFNRLIKNDPHVENVILPIRDGINMIVVND